MSIKMFDAVLCDLDGVLRRWDPPGMSELDIAYDLPAGTLAAAAFSPDRLQPAITGEQTDEQWRTAVAKDLIEVCGSAHRARDLVAEWSTMVGTVDDAVAGLLTQVRHHVPVILVSNATSRLETDLDELGITGLFDGVVNSARSGFAKPDPRIYHLAVSRAGVPAHRCLFIDDRVENTDAAHALGMTVVHYQGPLQLQNAFAPVLDTTKPTSLSNHDSILCPTVKAP